MTKMEWEPVRIPKTLYAEITKIVEKTGFWTNEHEFIRDALREKLSECIAKADVLVESAKAEAA